MLPSSNWHWQHYHKPYEFGKRVPSFTDYEFESEDASANLAVGNHNSKLSWQDIELMQRPSRVSLAHLASKLTANPPIPPPPPPKPTHPNPPTMHAMVPTAQTRTPTRNFDRLAQLSCDSGEMIVRLNFSEPFRGIVYPDHNRLSPCRFFGDGHHNYELRLPLQGCGTRQVSFADPSS